MTSRPDLLRTFLISAALAGAVVLSGCKSDATFPYSSKANAPIPPRLLAEIGDKNMDVTSPILVRVFKTESELEVWKKDRTGRYALLKTYPICKWSGDLGPKIKEGDRQAPEGFYDITPGQMNPNSQFYLAFNLGYPNAFDRAHDRTGAHLMVHGDCSSRGCYAMSDEQIQEIFALGRESFFGGQKSFQVQAYPFRMTAANMAKHRNNPNMPFWRMLKQGNDHFEVTRLEPKVDVCEKRYVFNAQSAGGGATPLNFSPRGQCPVYEVPDEIASAVYSKQRSDELQVAQLASRGVPVAPVRTGRDGGMHPTFVAKLQPREMVDERGNVKLVVDRNSQGSIVAYSSPQASDNDITSSARAPEPVRMANVPLPRTAPLAKPDARPASEPSFAEKVGNFFRFGTTNPEPVQTQVAAVEAPRPAPKRESVRSRVSRMVGLRGSSEQPQPSGPQADVKPAAPARATNNTSNVKTAEVPPAPAPAASAPAPLPSRAFVSGAQPAPSSSNFDSRWSAFR
ncbi:L,D-transpeptidase family protein [Pseudorhodoplanes sp.]|uniref:L,D-transpeptidase family protein n=1 Tax=Pseudorhodoplanes sp. TaxID=1934341 RepID=UPI003D0A9EEA